MYSFPPTHNHPWSEHHAPLEGKQRWRFSLFSGCDKTFSLKSCCVFFLNQGWCFLQESPFSPWFTWNSPSVCASVQRRASPDEWGSLWVGEHEELITGLRSAAFCRDGLWWIYTHNLSFREVLKLLRKSSTALLQRNDLTFQIVCYF